MIKGLKKLQAALFAVAVLLMFALVFTFVYGAGSGNEILPVAEASAETYEHGTLATQTPKDATSVSSSNVSEFSNLISSNTNISLTSDITLPYFLNTSSYRGTIYGNGHTITVSVPDVSGANSVTSMSRTVGDRNSYVAGGVIGELTGKIYDCKFVLGSGDYKIGAANVDPSNFVFGGIIGYINGGTVSNVQVEVLTGTDFRVFCWRPADRAYLGILTGAAASATVTNVTIENNGGTFRAGRASDTSVSSIYTDCQISISSNLVGYIDGATPTFDNIIIKGSAAELYAKYASNLGMMASASTYIRMTNYYNDFRGEIISDTNGGSTDFVEYIEQGAFGSTTYQGDADITNYFRGENAYKVANSGSQPSHVTDSGTVKVPSTFSGTILFDPTASSFADSLVIAFSGQSEAAPGITRTWALKGPNGNSIATTQEISGDTVVFAGLSSSVSTWSSGGTFTASISVDDSTMTGLPALTQYEHGYVDGEYSPAEGATGIAQEAGNGNVTFASVFSPTASGNVSGSYYLTEDIWVSGFSGKTMTSGAVLDGNGHTIYISGLAQPVENYSAADIGGIVGNMNGGTIKNLRIVIVGDYALQTSASRRDNRALGFGLVAGRMQNNATIENVTVVLQGNVSVNETDTTALGGVSGNLSGNAKIKNVTVQLDGNLSCTATYPFVAGFVGNTDSGSSGTYTNIILKGSGTFGGNATNAGGNEPLFTAAITILPGSGSAPLATIDGFIYALTADNPVSASSYSSYGYVSQNLASDNIANPGDGKPADGYVDYSNIFAVTTMTPYYSGHHAGNTYIAMKTTATITSTVEGAIGSRVTPYFVPGSTTDITLVATAGDWNGITRLQTNGSDKGDLRPASNGTIVVTAAKSEAYADGTITLSKYVAATLTVTDTSVQYSGSEANFGISVSIGDNILDSSNYTILYEGDEDTTYAQSATAPTNVGNYIITVTLTNGDMFEGNGGNLISFKQSPVTIIRADLPDTVTVSIEGWTYGASGNAPQMSGLPSGVTEENVSYTYAGRGDTSYSDSIPPVNAGEYTVTATINETANYNDGTVSAEFSIAKATLPTSSITVTMANWVYGTPADPVLKDANGYTDGAKRTYLYTGTGDTKYSSSTRPSDVGTYTLTVTFGESTNYREGSVTSAEFTISPKTLTFTVTAGQLVYGENGEASGIISLSPNPNEDSIEGVVDVVNFDVSFVFTLAEGDGEYSALTPAGTSVNIQVVIEISRLVGDEETGYTETSPNYVVTYDGDANAEGIVTRVVHKREVSLSVGSTTGAYGDATYNTEYFTGLFNLSGALSSDSVASLFDVNVEGQGVASLPNAGTYTVTALLKAEAAVNYTLADDSVNSYTYTITPFIVTGSIEPSAEYSGSAFTPEWTVTETLPNNETQEDMEVSVAYALNNSDSGVTTIQNVGQYTVTVTLGNTNYAFAAGEGTSQKQAYSFEVTKAENIFTTEFDPSWTYGEEPTIELPVAKFGDVSVTYYSDDSYNNVVESFSSTTAAGTYYYVITVEESANWTNGSMDLTGSFVVEKAQTTVTLSVEEGAVFDGAAYDGKITVELGNSAVSLGDVTWQYKVGDGVWTEGLPVNAGTYTISIKTYSNSGNVTVTNLGDATAQLVISPKDITFNAKLAEKASLTYGDTLEQDQMNALVNVGVAEGQESIGFTFTVLLMAGDVEFGSTTAADAIVTVSVEVTATDSNYKAVDPAELELTVQRRVLTGALGETSATYNGKAQTVTFVPDNVANGDAVTFAYSYTLNNNSAESILGAGTYTVKVTLEDDNAVNNNYTLNVGELTFTVNPLTVNATLSVNVNDSSIAEFADNALVIHGSNVDGVTFTISGSQLSVYRGSLAATISVTFAAADGTQYTPDDITFAIRDLALDKGIAAGAGLAARPVTVAFEDGDFSLGNITSITFEVGGSISIADGITTTVVYGEDTYDADYFTGYFVVEGEDAATITIYEGTSASGQPLDSISDADTYYVQGTFGGVSTGFTFTIMPKQVTVEVTNANDLIYTGSELTLTLTSDVDDMLSADGLTLGYALDEGVQSILNAGEYNITFTLTGADNDNKAANYKFTTGSTTIKVEKARLSVHLSIEGWTYGDAANEPNFTGNPTNNDGEVTVSYSAVSDGGTLVDGKPATAGHYTVTVTISEGTNYKGTQVYFGFNVAKRTVSVTVEGADSLVYTGSAITLNLVSSDILAADSEDAVLGYTLAEGTEILNAGEYAITFTLTGDKAGNYQLAAEGTTVNVAQKEINVTIDNADSLVYAGEALTVNARAVGVIGEDAVTLTYEVTEGEATVLNAGDYTLTFTIGGAQGGNYKFATGENVKSVTVQTRNITVSVPTTTFTYTGSEIEIGFSVGDEVFMNDQTAGNVVISYGTNGNAVINADSYEITFALSGDAADNYNLTNPSHTVTVNPANVTASISAPSATYDGAAYDGSITVALGNAGLSLGEITWQYRVGDGGWTEGLPVNAGTYTISIKTYSNSGNVTVTNLGDATAQLVIDKAQVRYTATLAEGAEIVFGDTFTQEQMNALVTVTDDGGVTVDTYTVRLELADGSAYDASVPVGTAVSIVIVPVVDEANYEVTVTEGLTLSVQSKAIDIVLDTDGNGETDEDKISSGATVTIQQGESLALAAAVEAFLEEQGIPAGSYRILIDGAEFAGTENLAARTYRMQVSLTGGYQGVLEFMLTVEGDDEPVAPPVDPDEPDDPDPDEPVDPDPEEPVDPDEPGTPDEPEQPAQPDGEGFPGWAIAVIVCGGLLVIAAVTGIAVAAARKRKKSGDKK